MRVLITGTAGRIGSALTARLIQRADLTVIPTDVKPPDQPVAGFVEADLLDLDAVRELVVGVEAVVHLGNIPSFHPPDPYAIYLKNVTMTHQLLQAAVEAGAGRFIYASSIQTIASSPQVGQADATLQPRYLPLDGEHPAEARNPYGLSKVIGETEGQYYARQFGVSFVAMRFPWVALPEHIKPYDDSEADPVRLANQRLMGFCYVLRDDLTQLMEMTLDAELPGYRCYMPASRRNLLFEPPAEVIRRHYGGVPLKRPVKQINALVDNAAITRDTGWQPSE